MLSQKKPIIQYLQKWKSQDIGARMCEQHCVHAVYWVTGYVCYQEYLTRVETLCIK